MTPLTCFLAFPHQRETRAIPEWLWPEKKKQPLDWLLSLTMAAVKMAAVSMLS
jgi:hypothetical protein